MHRSRRAPLQHIVLAAAYDDLASLQAVLDDLPEDAYGQIVIEVPHGVILPQLQVPPRVMILTAPIGAAETTIAALASEWLPDEPDVTRDLTIGSL